MEGIYNIMGLENGKMISVIIPCYNVENYITECIESLIHQTIGIANLELIFVDDCSSDGTANILKRYEQIYPESIILINLDKNGKQGAARNIGISYASGEYISFVDSDDYIHPEMYEILMGILMEHKVDVVQFRYEIFKNGETPVIEKICLEDCVNLGELTIYDYGKNRKQYLLNSSILNESCWQKIYKRSMIVESGLYFAEGGAYEEPLFTYPVKFLVNKVAVFEKSLYFYRENMNGTTLSYMNEPGKIVDHLKVQLELRKFMEINFLKRDFLEEKDMYFIHTFLYEPFFFMKKRGCNMPVALWHYLKENINSIISNVGENIYLSDPALQEDKMIVELLYLDECDDNKMQNILDDVMNRISL